MLKVDAMRAVQDVFEGSNQSWIRASARIYINEIDACQTDAEALEIATTAMNSLGQATSNGYIKKLVKEFHEKLNYGEKKSEGLTWWNSLNGDAKFQIKFENSSFDFKQDGEINRFYMEKVKEQHSAK